MFLDSMQAEFRDSKRPVVSLGTNHMQLSPNPDAGMLSDDTVKGIMRNCDAVAGIFQGKVAAVWTYGNGLLYEPCMESLLTIGEASSHVDVIRSTQSTLGAYIQRHVSPGMLQHTHILVHPPGEDDLPSKMIGLPFDKNVFLEGKNFEDLGGGKIKVLDGDGDGAVTYYAVSQDGNSLRRLVHSPIPTDAPLIARELEEIKRWLADNISPLIAGGGGIPTVNSGPPSNPYRSLNDGEVVDKDRATVGASLQLRDALWYDTFPAILIVTGVDGFQDGFGTDNAQTIQYMSADDVKDIVGATAHLGGMKAKLLASAHAASVGVPVVIANSARLDELASGDFSHATMIGNNLSAY